MYIEGQSVTFAQIRTDATGTCLDRLGAVITKVLNSKHNIVSLQVAPPDMNVDSFTVPFAIAQDFASQPENLFQPSDPPAADMVFVVYNPDFLRDTRPTEAVYAAA